MKINKIIKNAEYFIGRLKSDLDDDVQAKRIRSDKQLAFRVNMINAFIDLFDAVELLANADNQVTIMDHLLLGRIYDKLEKREYESFNWSQNIYVVEKIQGSNEVAFCGIIPTDALREGNNLMQYDNLDKITIVAPGNEFVLPKPQAHKLMDELYHNKIDTIDMRTVINEIDTEITYHPQLTMESIINFFTEKEAIQGVLTDRQIWQDRLESLLNEFKAQMDWQ